MSKQRFYYWLFFSLPIIYYLSLPITTGDLAVWVAQGKYFFSTGEILRHDIYSVLPTKNLIYPVGTCLIYALTYFLGGLLAVSLFHKLILIGLLLVWYKSSLQKIKEPWGYPSLLIIFLAWFGSSMFWVDRPALLGMFPLLLAFLKLQKKEDLNLADFFILTAINIAWVNLHGSWPLLVMMYGWREVMNGIFVKKRFQWQQLGGGALLLASSLINPFGYKVFSYILETANLSKERRIDEWAPPSLSGAYPSQAVVYFVLLVLMIILSIYFFKKDRAQLTRLLASPFIPLLLLGFQSIRNTALPFFVLIPFACEFFLVKGESVKDEVKKSPLNLVIVGGLIFLIIIFLPMVKPMSGKFLPENKRNVYDTSAPIEATRFLNGTQDQDPVFNDWEYGSFLILSQKHPIFIDTRNIIYGKNEFDEYQRVVEVSGGWETVLEKYKIKYVLLNRKLRGNLISELNRTRRWNNVLMSDETVLFQRQN